MELKTHLIIADNQDITQKGLIYLTQNIGYPHPIEICNGKKQMHTLLNDNPQSVVILDYTLFDFRSIEELMIFTERYPYSHWILFMESISSTALKQVIYTQHAISVVSKMASTQEIQQALIQARRAETFLCDRMRQQVDAFNIDHNEDKDNMLTPTEKEVLKAIALGKTTKEIAVERHLSFHTVSSHRKNIFRKLDVNNMHEATKYAIRAGIIDVAEYYI